MAFRGRWGNRGIRRNRGGRRFRRKGGIWLPTLGTRWTGGEETYHESAFQIFTSQVPNSRTFGPVISTYAIVPDFSFQPSEAPAGRQATLNDRTSGNSWFLDSIVGNIFLKAYDFSQDEGQWNYVQVAAGFFVSRSDDLSDAGPDLYEEELDPMNVDNIQNPWIWRRMWILSNPAGTGVMRDDFPISNAEMAAPSGPFVQTKAKRIIRREHRLWFTIAAMGWNGESISTVPLSTQPAVAGIADLRVVGRTVSNARGGGTF